MPNHYSRRVPVLSVVPLMPVGTGTHERCVKAEGGFGCGCVALVLLLGLVLLAMVQ